MTSRGDLKRLMNVLHRVAPYLSPRVVDYPTAGTVSGWPPSAVVIELMPLTHLMFYKEDRVWHCRVVVVNDDDAVLHSHVDPLTTDSTKLAPRWALGLSAEMLGAFLDDPEFLADTGEELIEAIRARTTELGRLAVS